MRKLLSLLALGLALLASPALAVVNFTVVGDAAYTILPTDTNVRTSVAFTAARTWTLPSAGQTCIGQTCAPPAGSLQITDTAGVITSTNTLTIAPASGETINGNAANLILNAPGVRLIAVPTSPSNWQVRTEGDFVKAVVATGSAVSLTTNTAADIVTQSLSQGQWECFGTISRNVNAATSFTKMSGSIGTTTNTLVAQGTSASTYYSTPAEVIATSTDTKVGPFRTSLTATTTMRLVAQDTFTVNTDAAFGELQCTRMY